LRLPLNARNLPATSRILIKQQEPTPSTTLSLRALRILYAALEMRRSRTFGSQSIELCFTMSERYVSGGGGPPDLGGADAGYDE
jgi:hypothetical protein